MRTIVFAALNFGATVKDRVKLFALLYALLFEIEKHRLFNGKKYELLLQKFANT